MVNLNFQRPLGETPKASHPIARRAESGKTKDKMDEKVDSERERDELRGV